MNQPINLFGGKVVVGLYVKCNSLYFSFPLIELFEIPNPRPSTCVKIESLLLLYGFCC